MTVAGKPISNYRLRPREIPAYGPASRGPVRPPLWEFVLLSMLMHATAIVLFGAPSGGSSEGRAMWGALNVVLRGAPVDAGPSLKVARELATPRTETRAPPPPRPVPPPIPQPALEPLQPALKLEPRIEPLIPPIAPPAELAPREPAHVVIPPLLDRIATPDRLPELAPFRMPPPTPVQVAPPAPVVAQPVPAPLPALPPVVAQPVPAPLPLPERVVTPHTEIAPVASPVIPALPSPPVIRPPVEVPALPAPTIETAAPVRVEPVAKPVESPTVREVPVTPPPMAAPIQQAPAPREAPARIDRAIPPAPRDAPALPTTPFGPGAPSDSGRSSNPGPAYDPTAPTVNVESIRQRAGEMARAGTGNRAVLPFPMPPVPEKKSKMADAIEKARKPDCRTAYSALGLAAVVPLIANEFGEGSCRW